MWKQVCGVIFVRLATFHVYTRTNSRKATKILLGAMVAVPGAFFCTSRQLEVLTSTFDHTKAPSLRKKLIVEVLMCIVIPILYMSLREFLSQSHSKPAADDDITDTIVQFRRFSILQDFGCQAAVYDSLPSLMLVWLPPFIASAGALIYSSTPLPFRLTHYERLQI